MPDSGCGDKVVVGVEGISCLISSMSSKEASYTFYYLFAIYIISVICYVDSSV